MGQDSGLVQMYVQKRGEKAAEFVEKYATFRKKIELPARMSDNEEYVKQMEKQAKREIKSLQAMVKKQDFKETVAGLTKSENVDEMQMAAYTALAREPPAKSVPALLTVAVNSTNVSVRARVLQMVSMLRYAGMQEAMQEEMVQAGPEATQALMKKFADKNKVNMGTNAVAWKILLADTRAAPGGRAFAGGAYEWTIADLAATGIEALYGETSPMEMLGQGHAAANLPPEIAMRIARERAAARLEGKSEDQLPEMPSADEVSIERRKVIEADILKVSPATLGAVIEKLSDSERLFLAEITAENDAIMKAMAPLSRRISLVKTVSELPAVDAARLQKLTGTLLTTNVIMEMRELCKQQLVAGKAFVIALTSSGPGKGMCINVTPLDDSLRRMYGAGYMSMISKMGKSSGKRKGLVVGALMGGQTYASAVWLVDLPALSASTGSVAVAAVDSDDKIDQQAESLESAFASQVEKFESVVEAFSKPDESLTAGATVSFIGIMPTTEADKKAKSSDDEEPFGSDVIVD